MFTIGVEEGIELKTHLEIGGLPDFRQPKMRVEQTTLMEEFTGQHLEQGRLWILESPRIDERTKELK